MRIDWQQYLNKQGAVIEQGALRHFGDPAAELAATGQGGICCDLSHTGLLLFKGADAEAFLHGQFSSDVKSLTPTNSQYAGYCSAKGRLLATLLLWKMADGYALQLPAELVEPIQKRLAMFVMRSKVTHSDASDAYARFGLAGAGAEAALQDIFGATPAQPHELRPLAGGVLIRLDANRFELVLEQGYAEFYWEKLAARLRPVGTPCWDWLDIRAGIPWITAATREQFVPQMTNLELIGGVSFNKGCYPGQEIVARTQYRGTLKRRMFLAHVDAATPPLAGEPLFGLDPAAEESGVIVSASKAPDGGVDLLAVLQIGSVEAGPLHLRAADGPPLSLLTLPYAA
jgi:folate-binding protein YgfZ